MAKLTTNTWISLEVTSGMSGSEPFGCKKEERSIYSVTLAAKTMELQHTVSL